MKYISHMAETSRRQFLRASAIAVPLIGAGTAVGTQNTYFGQQQALQQQDVPAYADWVPADDSVLDENEELSVGTLEIATLLEIIAEGEDEEDDDDDEVPIPFEAYIVAAFAAVFGWDTLDEGGLAEPVLGQSGQQAMEAPTTTDAPATRQLFIGDTSVYLGSFDTEEIESIVDDGDFEETDVADIFAFETPFYGEQLLAWDENYLVLGEDIDEVAAVIDAGTGEQASRAETDEDFARLLATAGQGEFVFCRLAEAETLTFDEGDGDFFGIDYSPLEGVQGYAHSNWFDIDAERLDAVTALSYPTEDAIDMDRLGGLGADASQRESRQDGRFVTIETVYDEEFATDPDDDEQDDEQDDDDEREQDDDGEGEDTDPPADDENEGEEETGSDDDADGQDDQEADQDDVDEPDDDADDNGAGFGVVAALSGLGGVGYLLSKRVGRREK